MMNIWVRTLISGALASITTSVALGACAKRQGDSASQPINATSHWLHGDSAALVRDTNVEQTGVGYATHYLAALIWAYMFEQLRMRRHDADDVAVSRDALITSATAALIDYTITPHRFT